MEDAKVKVVPSDCILISLGVAVYLFPPVATESDCLSCYLSCSVFPQRFHLDVK